jgi:DNA repair exonuclease SbcCD nuclease subunit
MKYLIFSDTHYYNNPSKSYINSEGVSSWLQCLLDITKNIFETAIKEKVDFVIMNGDLFEEKSRINVQLYNRVWELYSEYSQKLHIILNTGNHDLYTVTGESSLRPFSKDIWVITKPTEIEPNIWVYPFGYRNFLEPNPEITLFTHDEVDFFIKYPSEKVIPVQSLTGYRYVFNGHIHDLGQYQNVYSIGSIAINDFGEGRDGRRFLIVEDDKVRSIDIDCPKFYDLDSLNEIERVDDTNFFRIAISKSEASHEIFKNYNVFPLIAKTEKRNIRISSDLNEEERIKTYIEEKNDGLDEDKLYKVGLELIDD